jgi:hypothetical protein
MVGKCLDPVNSSNVKIITFQMNECFNGDFRINFIQPIAMLNAEKVNG